MNDHSILLLLLHQAVGPIYILLTAAALLSIISPALNSLSSHGKTRFGSADKCHKHNYNSGDISLYQQLREFLLGSKHLFVNKSRFIDFYAVGSIITTITILLNWSVIHTTTKLNEHMRLLPAYILLIHLIRRFCECLWVQKSVSTSSKMHVAGYLLGVIHYLFLPFVFVPIHDELGQDESSNNIVKLFMVVMGCLFFQYQQHRHHVILGNLRPNTFTSSSGINSYRIPMDGWFEFVSCPHYLAEIMIYFMLAILTQLQRDMTTIQEEENGILSQIHTQKHWIVLLWVFTNLSISSARTHAWYISTFGKAYPRRKKLIPFVW